MNNNAYGGIQIAGDNYHLQEQISITRLNHKTGWEFRNAVLFTGYTTGNTLILEEVSNEKETMLSNLFDIFSHTTDDGAISDVSSIISECSEVTAIFSKDGTEDEEVGFLRAFVYMDGAINDYYRALSIMADYGDYRYLIDH